MSFNELFKNISFDTFNDIIAMSPRKVRESLYSHYGIKSMSRNLLSSKEKKERRVKNLQAILQDANKPKEQEFLKELVRNWLFHQRPLLKSALDFLGVENNDGLVETETDFFKELDKSKVSALIKHLGQKFPKDFIFIYLTFMEVPDFDTLLD